MEATCKTLVATFPLDDNYPTVIMGSLAQMA